jgi:hypothetical protein
MWHISRRRNGDAQHVRPFPKKKQNHCKMLADNLLFIASELWNFAAG